jgi:hypothetical protein
VGFSKYAEEKSWLGDHMASWGMLNAPLEAKVHAQAFSADVAVQAVVFLLSETFGYAPEQPAWKSTSGRISGLRRNSMSR